MHPAIEVELERILMKVIDTSDFHTAVETELLRTADTIVLASAEEDYKRFMDDKQAYRPKYQAYEVELERTIMEVIKACDFPPELEMEIVGKAWAIINANEDKDLKDSRGANNGTAK